MSAFPTPEPDPRRWRALWVCLIAGFMTLLDVSIVNVALPSMEHGIGATPADVSWVVSGYALTFGLALVPAGRLGDDYGRRKMFLLGLALFVVTSALCGAAPNATWLVVARLAQGVAGGLLNPQVIGMMQQLFSGRERGKAFGAFGAVVGLSTAIGPVLGGLLIQGFGVDEGWRYVFYVNLPIGILAILFGLRLLPKDVRLGPKRAPDLLGTVLLGAAVVAVMLPLVEEEEQAAQPRWWVMGVAAGLLIVFVLWQRRLGDRDKHPLVNLKLLSFRSYTMGSLLGLVYFAGFTGIFLVLTLFFQQGQGYSALESGASMLAFAIGSAISPAIGGRLVHRLGRPMVVLGNLLAALGLAGTAWIVRDYLGAGTALVIAGPLFVAGFGSGLVIAPNSTLALEDVPPAEGGTAAGVLQTAQRIGSAIGTALGGSLFFGQLSRSHGDYHGAAALGLIGSTALVTLALLVGLADVVLSRSRKKPTPQPEREAAPEPVAHERRLADTVSGTVRGLAPGEEAAVTLTSLETHQVRRTATGADGTFALAAPTGTYLLLVTGPGYAPIARHVTVGSDPVREDVVLPRSVRLAGTVRADPGPFSGAQVTVLDAAGEVQRIVVTDDAGHYVVDGLAPGRYRIVVTSYEPAASPVELTADGPTEFDPRLRLASTVD
ncbi:MFS transporter [Amycolatopsis sp. FDAARGOS 1241]|uniref:MFS transporter n=1 Tax=Amycolatopsis sp. FDAARGOS 1241 TaxID=2778070 RepID=UPI00194DD098|nr:MFS transporter [Amycolatopsis sp. FDAARGOS 1241]QRP50171.1 DHA2 family efflux MFS transporter permease subunit [Amycolatopsis sp. FDAARGOS 1241]